MPRQSRTQEPAAPGCPLHRPCACRHQPPPPGLGVRPPLSAWPPLLGQRVIYRLTHEGSRPLQAAGHGILSINPASHHGSWPGLRCRRGGLHARRWGEGLWGSPVGCMYVRGLTGARRIAGVCMRGIGGRRDQGAGRRSGRWVGCAPANTLPAGKPFRGTARAPHKQTRCARAGPGKNSNAGSPRASGSGMRARHPRGGLRRCLTAAWQPGGSAGWRSRRGSRGPAPRGRDKGSHQPGGRLGHAARLHKTGGTQPGPQRRPAGAKGGPGVQDRRPDRSPHKTRGHAGRTKWGPPVAAAVVA
jgi:hypothetical protein